MTSPTFAAWWEERKRLNPGQASTGLFDVETFEYNMRAAFHAGQRAGTCPHIAPPVKCPDCLAADAIRASGGD